MIKWKLKEQYDVQDEKFIEIRNAQDAKVREAEQKVAELVAKKAELLRREVAEGKDLSSERAATAVEIEAAEKAVLDARELRNVAATYTEEEEQKGISVLDLTLDWNHTVIPEIREKELAPIVARMDKAKEEMYNALLDFYELNESYSDQLKELSELERKDATSQRRVHYHVHQIEQDYNLPITSVALDLNLIKDRRTLPKGIDRKPTPSK